MKLSDDVHVLYQEAYAKATTTYQQNRDDAQSICPPALDRILTGRQILGQRDLGIMEIPASFIIGVAEMSEEVKLYTTAFLPLADPKSEAARRWCESCRHYIQQDNHLREVLCYEYLGQFYVANGLERMSVIKFRGVPTVQSRVIRIITKPTGSKRELLYKEFLRQFSLTGLYQLQFTQPKYFAKLQAALGKMPDGHWSDFDRVAFLREWPKIEGAFYKAFDHSLNLTAADALGVLLEKYPYDLIIRLESWMLTRTFQIFWKELSTLSFPEQILEITTLNPLGIFQTA